MKAHEILNQANDPVNNPKHYEFYPDMDAIEVIRRTLSYQEYIGYLKGNALKYRLRAGDKGDTQQDIDKSNWYRRRLIDVLYEFECEGKNEHIDKAITGLLENEKLRSRAAFTCATPEEDEAFQALHIGTEWCDHSAGRHSYSSTKEAQCIDCKEMLQGGDDAKLTQHKRKSGVGPDT